MSGLNSIYVGSAPLKFFRVCNCLGRRVVVHLSVCEAAVEVCLQHAHHEGLQEVFPTTTLTASTVVWAAPPVRAESSRHDTMLRGPERIPSVSLSRSTWQLHTMSHCLMTGLKRVGSKGGMRGAKRNQIPTFTALEKSIQTPWTAYLNVLYWDFQYQTKSKYA